MPETQVSTGPLRLPISEMARMVYRNDRDAVKISLKRKGNGWKLVVVGNEHIEPRPVFSSALEVVLLYEARCQDLADALAKLDQWRKGNVP
jgi:hypothetical protein